MIKILYSLPLVILYLSLVLVCRTLGWWNIYPIFAFGACEQGCQFSHFPCDRVYDSVGKELYICLNREHVGVWGKEDGCCKCKFSCLMRYVCGVSGWGDVRCEYTIGSLTLGSGGVDR